MISKQRHQYILEQLKHKNVITMQDIVEATGSSESTIRRDLSFLEEKGKLIRIHGGAQSIQTVEFEPTYIEKMAQSTDEKVKIAQKAASLIQDGMYIYLDAGTTPMAMIPFLQHKKVTVVTNSLPLTNELLSYNIPTYMIGGLLKGATQALVGNHAREGMMLYNFDIAFLGMNGVDIEQGYTTPDPEEGLVKKTAMNRAHRSYVLVDESKLEQQKFSRVASLQQASIITYTSNESLLEAYAAYTEVLNAK